MNWKLLIVVGCIYAYVSYSLFGERRPGLGLQFLGYTLAAAGTIWDISQKGQGH